MSIRSERNSQVLGPLDLLSPLRSCCILYPYWKKTEEEGVERD